MEPNIIQQGPINFFMAGGKYISDNFNMKMIDTSVPNAFEDYNMTSVMPDMTDEYISSEASPPSEQQTVQEKGFIGKIIEFFTAPAEAKENASSQVN